MSIRLQSILAAGLGSVLMMAKDKETGGGAAKEKEKEPEKDEGGKQIETEGQEILRKISTKTILGNLKKAVMDGTTKLPCDLFTIIGRASNLRVGEGDNGPWTALLGEFEAVRLSDGQAFLSSQCFIPGPAGELLVNQVRQFITEEIPVSSEEFKKHGKTYKTNGDVVELALIVGAKPNERPDGAPYEFTVRPIVPVQKADALAALRDKMAQKVKLLAAPSAK